MIPWTHVLPSLRHEISKPILQQICKNVMEIPVNQILDQDDSRNPTKAGRPHIHENDCFTLALISVKFNFHWEVQHIIITDQR